MLVVPTLQLPLVLLPGETCACSKTNTVVESHLLCSNAGNDVAYAYKCRTLCWYRVDRQHTRAYFQLSSVRKFDCASSSNKAGVDIPDRFPAKRFCDLSPASLPSTSLPSPPRPVQQLTKILLAGVVASDIRHHDRTGVPGRSLLFARHALHHRSFQPELAEGNQ